MQYSTLESKCKGKDNADNPLLFFIQTYCLLDLLPHFLNNNIRFISTFLMRHYIGKRYISVSET